VWCDSWDSFGVYMGIFREAFFVTLFTIDGFVKIDEIKGWCMWVKFILEGIGVINILCIIVVKDVK
jgi:hypothetical protein